MCASFLCVVSDVRFLTAFAQSAVLPACSKRAQDRLSSGDRCYAIGKGKRLAMPTEKGPSPRRVQKGLMEDSNGTHASTVHHVNCIPVHANCKPVHHLCDQKLTHNMSTIGLDIARPFS